MTNYLNIPDKDLKATVLADLADHAKHDRIVKGHYWEDGKGCAVGCLLKSGNHIEYEAGFGIPVALARLEDTVFEGLPNVDSKLWPARFMGAALSVGETREDRMKRLTTVQWKFLYWLLTEHLKVEGEGEIFDNVRAAIAGSAAVVEPATRGEPIDRDAARAAAYAARAAAYAARAAARAAYAAAYAADAAYAAAYAAYAAAYAADAADAAYQQFANKLIELIDECM